MVLVSLAVFQGHFLPLKDQISKSHRLPGFCIRGNIFTSVFLCSCSYGHGQALSSSRKRAFLRAPQWSPVWMEALQGEDWLGVFPSVGVFLTVLGPLRTFPVIVSTSFSFSVVLEASLSERTYLLNFAQNLIIIYFFVCFLFPYNSLYILCSTYLFFFPQTLSFLFCIAV